MLPERCRHRLGEWPELGGGQASAMPTPCRRHLRSHDPSPSLTTGADRAAPAAATTAAASRSTTTSIPSARPPPPSPPARPPSPISAVL